MSVLTVFSLIACIGVLVLSGLVLGRDPSKRLYQVFGLFGLASAVWALGFAVLYSTSNAADALFWVRFYEIGLVFIPAIFYHFIVLFVHKDGERVQRFIISVGYSASVLFLFLIWTPLFANGVIEFSWGFYPSVGIGSRVFNAMFAVYIVLGFYELVRYFRSRTGFERNQVKYLLVATVVGFGLGVTNFLPLYGFSQVFPLGHIGAPIAVAILSYAIVKHRLMDIDVVIRKSVIYSALTAILATGYVFIVVALGELFQGLTGYKAILPTIVFALVIAVTFEPLHRTIQIGVDRLFFRKSYEQRSVATQARSDLREIVNPLLVANYLLRTIDESLKVTHQGVFLLDKRLGCFQNVAATSFDEDMYSEFTIGLDDNLVEFLRAHPRPLILEQDSERVFSRDGDLQVRSKLLEKGVSVVMPLRGRNAIVGILFLGACRSGAKYRPDDLELVSTLCDDAAASIENASLYDELQTSYLSTVKSLVMALEAKDKYTRGHSERVAKYARGIAQTMELEDKESQLLYEVALLHDVGKIGVSDRILNKPRKLTRDEYSQVQNHTVVGEKILSAVEALKDGLSTVRHHHERLNGDGYPDGLSESNIPLPARILAVADAYDAMTTSRPYRTAMTSLEAINELKAHACSQFDPQVVRAFIAVLLKTEGKKSASTTTSKKPRKNQRHLKTA